VLCPAGTRIATPSLYVVQSGTVKLVVEDGRELKLLSPGNLVSSQLSLVAALTGLPMIAPFEIVATQPTVLLKLDARSALQNYPLAVEKALRVLLLRFSQVTLRTLIDHLGVPRSIWATAIAMPQVVDVKQVAASLLGEKSDKMVEQVLTQMVSVSSVASRPLTRSV
jgi:hypothetical protein